MRMTVADIMSQCFVKISPECSADEALGLLHRYEETELYVTDKQGRLLGILPYYEIIKTQLSGESRDATVGQLMSRGVPVFQPDSDASEVARQLRDARHSRFPVVNSGRLVGVIARGDIIRLMAILRGIDGPAVPKIKAPKSALPRMQIRRSVPVVRSRPRRSTPKLATTSATARRSRMS